MFNLPTRLRIGPSFYTITTDQLSEDLGKCYVDKTQIKISSDLTDEKTACTLLHEMLHAILHEYNATMSDKLEETAVRAIESGLCGFAKDHQKVFQSIVKEMGKL